MFKKHKKGESGFTMVEVMVTVAIAGILAAMAIPAMRTPVSTYLRKDMTQMYYHILKARSMAIKNQTSVYLCLGTEDNGTGSPVDKYWLVVDYDNLENMADTGGFTERDCPDSAVVQTDCDSYFPSFDPNKPSEDWEFFPSKNGFYKDESRGIKVEPATKAIQFADAEFNTFFPADGTYKKGFEAGNSACPGGYLMFDPVGQAVDATGTWQPAMLQLQITDGQSITYMALTINGFTGTAKVWRPNSDGKWDDVR